MPPHKIAAPKIGAGLRGVVPTPEQSAQLIATAQARIDAATPSVEKLRNSRQPTPKRFNQPIIR